MPKTINYKRALLSHTFSNGPIEEPFSYGKPTKCWVTLHESVTNPSIQTTIPTSWFTDTNNYKTKVDVSSWSPVDGDYSLGAKIATNLPFEYVPVGETWNIKYYIIWGDYGNDIVFPLYYGTFTTTVVMTELQLLYLQANNLVINEG
jgi:hypothetical protein